MRSASSVGKRRAISSPRGPSIMKSEASDGRTSSMVSRPAFRWEEEGRSKVRLGGNANKNRDGFREDFRRLGDLIAGEATEESGKSPKKEGRKAE